MSRNIIFYFSGTGNTLQLAERVQEAIPDCVVVSIGHNETFALPPDCERVGFLYPTYYMGIPNKVSSFVKGLDFSACPDAYIFAVATYGGVIGNGISQMKKLLGQKGVRLDYAEKITMFANYVVLYNMRENVDEIALKSELASKLVIDQIKNKVTKATKAPNFLIEKYYEHTAKKVPTMDRNFNVSSECNACALCAKVCPVGNIKIVDNVPIFHGKCEQCVACIQFCPKRAINYKKATQNRGRYTNPQISAARLEEANKNISGGL